MPWPGADCAWMALPSIAVNTRTTTHYCLLLPILPPTPRTTSLLPAERRAAWRAGAHRMAKKKASSLDWPHRYFAKTKRLRRLFAPASTLVTSPQRRYGDGCHGGANTGRAGNVCGIPVGAYPRTACAAAWLRFFFTARMALVAYERARCIRAGGARRHHRTAAKHLLRERDGGHAREGTHWNGFRRRAGDWAATEGQARVRARAVSRSPP